MKIRSQNLLAITPLFLGLAVIISVLLYMVATKELNWGFDAEVTSMASCAGAFLMNENLDALLQGDAPSFQPSDTLRQFLNRSGVERLNIYELKSGKVLWSSEPDAHGKRFEPLADAQIEELWKGNIVSGGFERHEEELAAEGENPARKVTAVHLSAFARVLSKDGDSPFVAGVEVDASEYDQKMGELSRMIVGMILAVTLIGVGVALLISRMINMEIEKVRESASLVGTDAGGFAALGSPIREVNELSNTLNTMNSVLQDSLSKASRTLIEAEQFRSEKDLLGTYQRWVWKDLMHEGTPLSFLGCFIGSVNAGDFFGHCNVAGKNHAFVGRLKKGGGIEAVVRAGASEAMIRELLKTRPVTEAFAEIHQLFKLDCWQCASWQEGTSQVQVQHESYAGQSLPPMHEDTDGGSIHVLHTFGEHGALSLRRYIQRFSRLEPEAMLKDLRLILEGRENGVALIIKPLAPHIVKLN